LRLIFWKSRQITWRKDVAPAIRRFKFGAVAVLVLPAGCHPPATVAAVFDDEPRTYEGSHALNQLDADVVPHVRHVVPAGARWADLRLGGYENLGAPAASCHTHSAIARY
jgi:hypothetical protein